MTKRLGLSFLFAFLVFGLCLPQDVHARRIPSQKSASSLLKSYFNRYSAKYKESLFAGAKVTTVQVSQVQELSRRLAEVEGNVEFGTHQNVQVLVTIKKVPPLGWKVVSWEKAAY